MGCANDVCVMKNSKRILCTEDSACFWTTATAAAQDQSGLNTCIVLTMRCHYLNALDTPSAMTSLTALTMKMYQSPVTTASVSANNRHFIVLLSEVKPQRHRSVQCTVGDGSVFPLTDGAQGRPIRAREEKLGGAYPSVCL